MNFEANIETAESVKGKAKAAFGLDLSSALETSKASNALFNAMIRGEL